MIGLIQRVSEAKVDIDGQTVGRIDQGLLVLLGVEQIDDEAKAKKLAERISKYRVAGKIDNTVDRRQFIARSLFPPYNSTLKTVT